MKNPKAFLTDTLNRLKRSIEITGTGMNFRGRKAITFTEFRERFLKNILFSEGPDEAGYYGVQLFFRIDGQEFIFDTKRKRAMVFDKDRNPVIFDIHDQKMIDYLIRHFSTDFGDLMAALNGGRAQWRDYASPPVKPMDEDLKKLLLRREELRKAVKVQCPHEPKLVGLMGPKGCVNPH